MAPPDPAESLLVQIQSPSATWLDVGRLTRSGEINRFQSFTSYWSEPDRPVLGQIFEERGPGWTPSSRVALPNWFSHLLPEGRLRKAVAEAADVKIQREFFLLSRIGGDDLPGAIRTLSADGPAIETDPVDEQDHEASTKEDPALRFSLAGVQLKFSIRLTEEKGLTIPAAGQAGDWIAKLPDPRPGFEGVPESEFAALELARAIGVEVPRTRLIDPTDIAGLPAWAVAPAGRALLIERFDRRDDDARVHVEELAQVLSVSTGDPFAKYKRLNFETVASVTSGLCGQRAVADVLERLVINILVGNGDAHAKNWAYIYPDGRQAQMSPAYDILPTVLFMPGDDLGLNLADSRSFNDIRLKSFDHLLDRCDWSIEEGRGVIRDAIDRTIDAWALLADHLPSSAVDRLTVRRDALPLLGD
jgi:serine/threonine-protein kinase HipA